MENSGNHFFSHNFEGLCSECLAKKALFCRIRGFNSEGRRKKPNTCGHVRKRMGGGGFVPQPNFFIFF